MGGNMAIVPRDAAVQRLLAEIEQSKWDDILAVYDELFPESSGSSAPSDNEDTRRDSMIAAIQCHAKQGLEVEEILDLWNVVFPKHVNVWYEEESETIHFNEEAIPVNSTK